jgi:hypothetical protein
MVECNLAKVDVTSSSLVYRSMKKLLCICIGLVLCLVSFQVSAQTSKSWTDKDESGYGYEFSDDPLNAGGFGPNDATIRVRPRAARTTLIRPRVSFVPEMLKSVENI